MNETELELHRVLATVRAHEQTIPLLATRYAADAVKFRPLPAELFELISTAPDYTEIMPGEEPTWIRIVTGEAVFGLVLYRALSDEQFYILGPPKPTLQ